MSSQGIELSEKGGHGALLVVVMVVVLLLLLLSYHDGVVYRGNGLRVLQPRCPGSMLCSLACGCTFHGR